MNRLPQNTEELRAMLHKGMGRAVLFLLSQDISQYRDMILDCCLHNYTYDQQVEGTRADYLYQLIKRSGEEHFYRTEILHALSSAEDYWDVERFLDYAVFFARDGDEGASEAIYERLKRSVTEPDMQGEDQAIKLDGAEGLVRVLEIISAAGCTFGEDDIAYLVEDAVEVSGAAVVQAVVQKAAAGNTSVLHLLTAAGYSPNSLVDEVVSWRERPLPERGRPSISEITTWEEVRDNLGRCSTRWSKVASEQELAKAARAFDPDDPKHLQSHLRVFWKRAFPLDPEPLIGLVGHPNEKVAIAALTALKNVSHWRVRDLFDRLREDEKWSDRAVELLKSNYRSGDELIIMDMLERESDPEKLHSLAMDATQVYKDHLVSEGMQVMQLAYEKTPCSNCRNSCLDVIESLGPVPDWMIEECLYDAVSNTRETATRLKKADSSLHSE